MRNLRYPKVVALGLSVMSTLAAGSLARTISIASQSPFQAALLPALGPAVAHLPPGGLPGTSAYTGPRIKGNYGVLSLHTKTGRMSYSENPQSDDPLNPDDPIRGFNTSKPFTPSMQGLTGSQ